MEIKVGDTVEVTHGTYQGMVEKVISIHPDPHFSIYPLVKIYTGSIRVDGWEKPCYDLLSVTAVKRKPQ